MLAKATERAKVPSQQKIESESLSARKIVQNLLTFARQSGAESDSTSGGRGIEWNSAAGGRETVLQRTFRLKE